MKLSLFSKDKDLILKITNAILLFWLLGAIIVTFNFVLNFVLDQPVMTYAEYETNYCKYYSTDVTYSCEEDYNNNLEYSVTSNYDKTKNVIISAGNIIIVGAALIILNRKKSKK